MNLDIVIIIANIIIMFLAAIRIEYETKEAIKTTVEQIERKLNNTNNSMIELKLSDIEKNLLTATACLGTKNNKDIKEIKDKIVTGKKNEKISQLIDENNELKKKNKKLKEENTKLNEENNKLKKEKGNKISNNNAFSYCCMPVYNPYTGVISLHEYNVVDTNNYKW